MKKIEVPLSVMEHTFTISVTVKTWEDYHGLDELSPEIEKKVRHSLKKEATVEAQRGKAMVMFIRHLFSQLEQENKGVVYSRLAELCERRDGLQNTFNKFKKDDPNLWEGEETIPKQIAQLEKQVQWHRKLADLLKEAPEDY
jgi:hypothetical protein